MQPSLPQTVIISLRSPTRCPLRRAWHSGIRPTAISNQSHIHTHGQAARQRDAQMEGRQKLTGHWLIKMANHRRRQQQQKEENEEAQPKQRATVME